MPKVPEDKLYHDKRVASFGIMQDAWLKSRMEFDKHILYMSFAAIGFNLTILRDAKNTSEIYIIEAGILSFWLSIGLILFVFRKNAKHLGVLIDIEQDDENNKEKLESRKEKLEKILKYSTIFAWVFFLLGIVLTCLLFVIKKHILN